VTYFNHIAVQPCETLCTFCGSQFTVSGQGYMASDPSVQLAETNMSSENSIKCLKTHLLTNSAKIAFGTSLTSSCLKDHVRVNPSKFFFLSSTPTFFSVLNFSAAYSRRAALTEVEIRIWEEM